MKKLYSQLIVLAVLFVSTVIYANTPSRLVDNQCNTGISDLNTLLYCYIQPNAVGYKFEVMVGTSPIAIIKDTNKFKLSEIPSVTYNDSYMIRVATRNEGGEFGDYGNMCSVYTLAPPAVNILSNYCDITVPSLQTPLYCERYDNAEAYEFQFSHGAASPQLIETTMNKIALSEVPGLVSDAAYSIAARAKFNGSWGPFGSLCNISTPSFPEIAPEMCGQTLSKINDPIITQGDESRKYAVTHPNGSTTLTSIFSNFDLTMIEEGVSYEATYSVRAINNGAGVQAYSKPCVITTPSPPVAKIANCGERLSAMNDILQTEWVYKGEEYRYELSDGETTYYHTGNSLFRLTDFDIDLEYDRTYTIRVAVRYSGYTEFVDYGSVCSVTTPFANKNRLLDTYCNSNLSSINSLVYAFRDDAAQAYQFEITDGSSYEVIETSANKIKLADLSQVKSNTTYNVRVRNKYNGYWVTYGPTCTVTTPEFTVLVPTQCGQTLGAINSLVYCYTKQNTDQYAFEVTEGNNTQTIVASSNKFSLTQLDGGAKYNTTYTIRVAIRQNGVEGDFGRPCTVTTPRLPLTQLTDSRCGVTLNTLDQTIYCYLKDNVQEYIFEINDGTNTVTHNATANKFALTDVEGLAKYGTTYTIRVATIVAGQQSDFGTECTVTTPNAPLTRLVDMQCGIELESKNTVLYAYRNVLAEQYRFEVSREGTIIGVHESPSNKFRISYIDGLAPNTSYKIKAAAMYYGQWNDYGSGCLVTTPDETKLVNTQCDKELNTLYQTLYCYIKPDVEHYVFEVTDGSEVQVFTRENNKFTLEDWKGGAEYETDYEIRVAMKKEGQPLSAFGEMCMIRTPNKPISKLTNDWCDVQISNINSIIYCYRFDGAEKYRFKVTDDFSTRIHETGSNKFILTQLGEVTSESIYQVQVAVRYKGEWVDYGDSCFVETPVHTNVVENQCGGQVSDFDHWVYCYKRPGAELYTFEVSDGQTTVQYQSEENKFKLSEIGIDQIYRHDYSVRVAITSEGQLRTYGKLCTIKSPDGPITRITDCSSTMTDTNALMTFPAIDGAQMYKVIVYKGSIFADEFEVENNSFYMTDIDGFTHGNYYIKIAVKLNNVWYNNGDSCLVNVPFFSTYGMNYWNCGRTIPYDKSMNLSSTNGYHIPHRFEVVSGDDKQIIERPKDNYFITSSIQNIKHDAVYTIRVSVYNGYVWSPYTGECSFTTYTPTSSRLTQKQVVDIEIKSYPNPYTDTFHISYPSDSEGTVNVSIYDMSGRQVAQSQHEAATLSEQYFGQGLSAGIYNVILEHGTEVKTLRVVKQ